MTSETRRKQYVEVNADHKIDGSVEPQKIILRDRPAFIVDDVKDVTKVAVHSKFATTNRYTVVVEGKETFLYEDGGRWFVKMKT
jgi:hypothetical protein